MKLASLFSGGKDSTYAIYKAQKQGHEISCILSMLPKSDESHLLHYPNMQWTKLQCESMNIPQLSIGLDSDNSDDELSSLEKLLVRAMDEFDMDGLVHGGIKSKFQKDNFEKVCSKLDLIAFAPLWNMDSEQYMNQLVDSNFDFIVTAVSSAGLDDSWLGKNVSQSDIPLLKSLSEKFGFNLNFEGGEAETFVVNCPLFTNSIKINQFEKTWDGYRGRFQIVDAELNYNA